MAVAGFETFKIGPILSDSRGVRILLDQESAFGFLEPFESAITAEYEQIAGEFTSTSGEAILDHTNVKFEDCQYRGPDLP